MQISIVRRDFRSGFGGEQFGKRRPGPFDAARQHRLPADEEMRVWKPACLSGKASHGEVRA
ncbi:MAG: hypothetical protein OXC93_00660 [Rhodospirillaceae bacterium]|nr:hypothetical protein [Rhodospirillaceae bacterium]